MTNVFPSPEAGLFGRRQKRERGARIPVTVVTGPLGAGKTTLIRRFLGTPEGRGTAVIVNELGAVGIDDALVRSSADETVLLSNGCLCCTARSDLEIALRRLIGERAGGRVPHFSRVIIETSGLADPGPVLRTFATDRALGGECHVEAVIGVIDAVIGAGTLDQSPEARRQIMFSDRLIVSKPDLGGAHGVAALEIKLRALNERGTIVTALDGAVDPRCFMAAEGTSDRLAPASAFHAEEARHSDGIESFVIRRRAPVDWSAFSRAMETLLALRGADLLRVKGLVNVAGCRGPVVVQFVQHLAHPPVELAVWPDEDRETRIVFIARGLDRQAVEHLLDAVAALTP